MFCSFQSFVSVIKLISKYFVLFDATISEIIFLISSLDCLLLMDCRTNKHSMSPDIKMGGKEQAFLTVEFQLIKVLEGKRKRQDYHQRNTTVRTTAGKIHQWTC